MSENKEKMAIRYLFESEPDYAWTPKDISRTLGLRGKQLGRLHQVLHELVRDGTIVQTRQGQTYTLAKRMDLITGPLRVVRNGAGNVTDQETGETVW
ncbi:MAG: hypothetical protein J6U40_00025, partial [Kiritimatiellae bacterium]|nr:hypothetical protein [Kiritimatiellia bacterium]